MSLDQVNPERLHCLAQGRGKLQSLWKVLVYGQRNGDAQVIEMIMGDHTEDLCFYHKTVSRPYDKTAKGVGVEVGGGNRRRDEDQRPLHASNIWVP